jgi:prolyl-tRNA editing enzyme YbaK/EbsC (Cys-tRNA(Pro) deacylase)
MSSIFHKNTQLVQSFIQDNNLDCKILKFPEGTKTSQDAANAVGCDIKMIAKSIIFKSNETHRPIFISVSGPNRVSEKIVEQYIGENISKADGDFVREVTGFPIGGVAPFPHKNKIELAFIDEDLLQFEYVWVAAGTPDTVFIINTSKLIEITNSKPMKIH